MHLFEKRFTSNLELRKRQIGLETGEHVVAVALKATRKSTIPGILEFTAGLEKSL